MLENDSLKELNTALKTLVNGYVQSNPKSTKEEFLANQIEMVLATLVNNAKE